MKITTTAEINMDELCDSLRNELNHKQIVDFIESLIEDSSDEIELWKHFKKRCDKVNLE